MFSFILLGLSRQVNGITLSVSSFEIKLFQLKFVQYEGLLILTNRFRMHWH